MRARKMMTVIAVLAIALNGFMLNWSVRIGVPVGSALGQSIPANTRNTAVQAVARVTLHDRSRDWQEESDNMAFVTNTWISVNGDANDANSWSGGIPAANDVCVFDDTSQQSMTANLDVVQTFEQLLVTPSYAGNIGSAGDPWRIDLGIDTFVYRGAGQAYIHNATGSSMNVIVDVDRSLTPNQYSLFLGGLGVGNACSVSMVSVKRGRLYVLGDVNLSGAVHVLGSDAELYTAPNLGAMVEPTEIITTAGFLENHRVLSANRMMIVGAASRVKQIGALLASTHVVVIGNGKFEYVPLAAPGTSPKLSVMGGVYNQTNEKYDNTWGTVILGPDGTIIDGTVRGTAAWPPSYDLREEYPGPQS